MACPARQSARMPLLRGGGGVGEGHFQRSVARLWPIDSELHAALLSPACLGRQSRAGSRACLRRILHTAAPGSLISMPCSPAHVKRRGRKDLDWYDTGDVPARGRNDKAVRIMDPVHNFIDVSEYPVVLQLIDTPHFQRLKSLQQLGLAPVVYPNATHTRFAHSIGVMHVFLTLFDSVVKQSRIGAKTIRQIRPVGAVAALLHDIGHGPLSHASERFLEDGEFNHERMTRDIVMTSSIAGVLKRNDVDPRLVIDLLRGEPPTDLLFVSQLLSSQLDADRMDYLMRDSLFTGLEYGRIDMHRIASTMRLWDEDRPEGMGNTVVVDAKGIESVANYILARYFMYKGVYQHKTIRCAEAMLAGAFDRAAKLPGVGSTAPGLVGRLRPGTLLSLDDHACHGILRAWAGSEDPILRDLSRRLLLRDLFKTVTDINPVGYIDNLLRSHAGVARAFKERRLDMDYYFIYDDPVPAGYRPYTVAGSSDKDAMANHILVADKAGRLEEISRLSGIVDATTKLPRESRIFCPDSVAGLVRQALSGGVRA